MVNANIDIFKIFYEESVSYFKHLKNLEKIRRINGHTTLPEVDDEKFATISVGKYSKNPKGSNMWCKYCGKTNHNTAGFRAIAKFKQQNKDCFEAKAGPRKNSLTFFLMKLMHSKGS
jgi:hypothetical protein